jgi:hypothetical protein
VYDYYRLDFGTSGREHASIGAQKEEKTKIIPGSEYLVGDLFLTMASYTLRRSRGRCYAGLTEPLRFTRVPATIVFEFGCRLELIRGSIHRSVPFFVGIVVGYFDVPRIDRDIVSS